MNMIKFLALAIILSTSFQSIAQCENWNGSPKMDELSDAHSIYRGMIKNNDFDGAFESWEKVFKEAPAADGRRDIQYTDGVKIYIHKGSKVEGDAKAEFANKVNDLYNQAIKCHEAGAITLSKMDSKTRMGYLSGRKVFDLFYNFQFDYNSLFNDIEKAVEYSGNATEYIVFQPFADISTFLYTNDLIKNTEVRALYQKLIEIADYNIENNKKYGSYYQQAKDAMVGTLAPLEQKIFDCDFFVAKYKKEYEANPDNPEIWKNAIGRLKGVGCDASVPFLKKMEDLWSKHASSVNAAKQDEWEANNPAIMAKKLMDAGDFNGAIGKYQEAINGSSDTNSQGTFYYRIAFIEGFKLNQYSKARATARKAAKLKPNWGQPFILIGDLYAKGARSCGDNFMQRCAILAAIDKYAYAKSIDSGVADTANKRISKYSGSKPDKSDAFMQGYKAGSKIKVGCWIGETVSLRF